MPSFPTAAGGVAVLLLFTACGTPQPAPGPAAPAPLAAADREPSALDGIYTLEQAQRGEEVFSAICSECHDPADYTDGAFLQRWNDQSVYQLFHQIYTTMPYGAPGSLTRQQYADVLTYILHLNEMPTGPGELGSTDDALDDYWLYWLEGP